MTNGKFVLSAEDQRNFQAVIEQGILKELHRRGVLTYSQLSFLLSDIQKQNTCALYKNTCALQKDVV